MKKLRLVKTHRYQRRKSIRRKNLLKNTKVKKLPKKEETNTSKPMNTRKISRLNQNMVAIM